MSGPVSRKTFLTSLGAAGLGAGLLRFAPPAAAQDEAGDDDDTGGMMGRHADWEQVQIELYAAFTEALATELGSTADDVDAGIRKAIMTVIDSKVTDDGEGLTKGKAEALKVIIATIDVPIGPPPVFMLGMGMQMHGGMGMHGGGMPGSGMGPGPGPHGGHGEGGRIRIKERGGDGRGKRGGHGKRDTQSLWPDDDGMTPPAGEAPAAPAAPAAPGEGTPEPAA